MLKMVEKSTGSPPLGSLCWLSHWSWWEHKCYTDIMKGDKCDCEVVRALHKWYEGDTSVTRVLHEVCERVGWMPWKFVWWQSVVGVKNWWVGGLDSQGRS